MALAEEPIRGKHASGETAALHVKQPRHAQGIDALLLDDHLDGEVLPREQLSLHTTYRIGGAARYYVRVDSIGALIQLIDACEQENVPWTLIGRGSNLLVSDNGFDGVVITLGRDFRKLTVHENENIIASGAGVLLSAVVQEAFRRSLAGLEFAVGTPGTLGGALRMNAGSAKEWIGEHVLSVTTLTPGVGLQRRRGEEIEWGYRQTSFAPNEIVLECELQLEPADPFYIRGKMEANLTARKKSQPLDLPSCGSVFRNPEGHSAAKLIDDAGLKGTTIGGAQVSEKHANFIVNTGGATAEDVCTLIELVRNKVREIYGIELTTEVKFLGF